MFPSCSSHVSIGIFKVPTNDATTIAHAKQRRRHKTTRIHCEPCFERLVRERFLFSVQLLSRDILGVLGRMSEKISRALSKTVQLFKQCKLDILIKFSGLSQAVSLYNPNTCVKKLYGSAMEQQL